MEKLWAEYRDKGYLFIGMNIWDSETEARTFAEDYPVNISNGPRRENKVHLDYDVESLPLAFFLRPGLEVDRRHLGELKEADLRSMLDDLVAAP